MTALAAAALSTTGLVGVTSAVATAAPSTGSQALAGVQPAPKLPTGARPVGAESPSATVSGAVALKLPSQAAVQDFIAAVTDPKSPAFHHYLTRNQFADRFGPSAAAVGAVEAQLRADGLRVTGVSDNRELVAFSSTASRVEAAFHTGLERVALAGGAIGRATTSAVRLPADVARDTQAVLGLDDLVREQSMLAPTSAKPASSRSATVAHGAATSTGSSYGGPVACGAAAAGAASGALTDQQIAAAYGVDPLYGAGDLASNQTVDIYELEPFAMSDIAAFDTCYFGHSHTGQISVTQVDGGPGVGYGSVEAALDVEDVSAVAPGAHIHVFEGPNTDGDLGYVDTWNSIVQADDAHQISTSWGECEAGLIGGAPGAQQVENQLFEQAAAQGQTIFAAAGDDGSDSCAYHASTPESPDISVLDPASQPYVTAVGGTTISNVTTEPPGEAVWNNGNDGGAGGGGISSTWAMPSWQYALAKTQTPSPSTNSSQLSYPESCSNDPSGTGDAYHAAGQATVLAAGTPCRELPDVSALADPQTGITIYFEGSWTQIGGTSSATPLWAAMLAEINGSAACHGLSGGVGFALPLLYDVAASSSTNYSDAFHDITQGTNDNLDVGNGDTYPATAGYDLASGLGSPRVTDKSGTPGLDAQLCGIASGSGTTKVPTVSGLSSPSGAAAGGSSLTITGANFGPSAGHVFFGAAEATVTAWSPTSVTVTVPAYTAPQGSASGLGGSADVEVVTAGSTQLSSTPTPSSVYYYDANSSGKPVVDYVSSFSGPAAGGNTVDIIGSGFTGTSGVAFGNVAATSYTVKSNSVIQAKVPSDSTAVCAVSAAQGVCAVGVTVTTPDGTSATPDILPAYQGPISFAPDGANILPANCNCEITPAPGEYDYAPAPVISSVQILGGYASEAGGTTAVINGSGFNVLNFEFVNIGPAGINTDEDEAFLSITANQVVVTIPGYAATTTDPVSSDISVQTPGGISNVKSFDYAGVPTLSSISKHVASHDDPGSLSATGSGLIDVTSVEFETQTPGLTFLEASSSEITDQTDNRLTVRVPESFVFPADVLLCSVTGCTSPDPSVDTFILVYPGRPVLTASTPKSGPAHGGTVVTLQGSLDSDVTGVSFGSTPGTVVAYTDDAPSGIVEVVAPPGQNGHTVPITITTLGGAFVGEARSLDTSAATFTYKESSPGAPTKVHGKAGVGKATVTWSPPTDAGGARILGYVVTATAKGRTSRRHSLERTGRTWTFTGLAPHVKWTLTVRAVNAKGAGLPASVVVTTT